MVPFATVRIALVLWLALILCASWSACFYDELRLEGVKFRCDATHGCPMDQKCIDGFCGDAQIGEVGVVCGDAFCAGSLCCDDAINAPRCVAAGPCSQLYECDGTEDCDTGERCCANGADTDCQVPACSGQQVCSTSAQCPTATPNCCPAAYGDFKVCELTPC